MLRNSLDPDLDSDPDSMNMDPKHCELVIYYYSIVSVCIFYIFTGTQVFVKFIIYKVFVKLNIVHCLV